jgi:hypothetical protein
VDVPVVEGHEDTSANVLVDAKPGTQLSYAWKASGGSMRPANEATAHWDSTGLLPASYTLSVTVTAPDGSTGSCSVVVIVASGSRAGLGTNAATLRKLRSALLLPGKKEGDKFGLYSYLLLGSKPNSANRERYAAFLKAFTDTVVPYDRLSEQLPSAQINITYMPVRDDLSASQQSAANFKIEDWLLDHYDYARAKRLLESIPGTSGDGPFIVSANHPVPESGAAPDKYLLENLNTVPVSIVKFWVDQFRIQTSQERWDQAGLRGVALRVRTAIEIASIAYPEIRTSIATLIKGN